MINGMNDMGPSAAILWQLYLAFPNQWLPPANLPGINVPAELDKLVSINMLEVQKNEAGEYFYRATLKAEDIFINRPELPSVYNRVHRIISENEYGKVKAVFDTTPTTAKRWEKIEYISDERLEDLLGSMDAWLRRNPRKKYKDLTLVLHKWEQRRVATKQEDDKSEPQQTFSDQW